jgi:tRNA pseudouridine38-40 synthase
MRTLRLLVAYDGTDFHGWQVQPNARTVQGEIESALTAVLRGAPESLAAAGRTDAGVHARGQVVSFQTGSTLPAQAVAPLANRLLPRDARVVSASDAAPGFHARHDARTRRYAYRIVERPDVLLERFAWRCQDLPPVDRLEHATRTLVGEAEFGAFQGAGSATASGVCRVHETRWTRHRGGVRFDIVANRFLYHMVRNIVGTALVVARTGDPAGAMAEVLASGDRRRAGVTVPPRGLCLERVRYE